MPTEVMVGNSARRGLDPRLCSAPAATAQLFEELAGHLEAKSVDEEHRHLFATESEWLDDLFVQVALAQVGLGQEATRPAHTREIPGELICPVAVQLA